MHKNIEKQLMQSGLFQTRAQMLMYLILRAIRNTGEPVGSWALKDELHSYGIECSAPTIGRHLHQLDQDGMTEQKSNLGRILTQEGLRRLTEMEESLESTRVRLVLGNAVRITKLAELIDLIKTRRLLETEAARLAATHASEDEIDQLWSSVLKHQDTVGKNLDPTKPALEFHSIVAMLSHNKFIQSLLDILIYEEKLIEATMDDLVTRERGRSYVREHRGIVEAIGSKDAQKAADLMYKHINNLYEAIKKQIADADDVS